MKAALLVEPGRIEIDDVPDPDVGPDDVRIAVGGVGLCGSDVSVFSGKWTAPSYPWLMGHEAFGTIDSVGDNVPPSRVGQTVVVEPNAACFTCDQCRRGWTSACSRRHSVGMNRPGALAERLVVPSPFAWSIADVGAANLVCVEPTTVVLAALRRLGSALPDAALVVGVGAQGLLMSLLLQQRGAEVHVFDVNLERAAFAEQFGARAAASGEDELRFGLVVDTVGSPASVATALSQLGIGGTLLFLGLDDRPLGITAQTLVRRQLVLRGSLTYDHPVDFEASVALVGEGRFAPGRIVSHEYALTDAQEAFDRSAEAAGKTWIRVSDPMETP